MVLSSKHFDNLQHAREQTFADKCILIRKGQGAANDYNYPSETETPDTYYTPCGFGYARSDEAVERASEAPIAEAYLRLPPDTDITNLDQVQITHRKHAELATPLTFDVIGSPITRKSTGVILRLVTATEL